MNVVRSSIRGLDRSFIENGVIKSLFFGVEASSRRRSQLTLQRPGRRNVNKAKSKSFSFEYNVISSCFWWFSYYLIEFGLANIVRSCLEIRLALLRGGIESNPGPEIGKDLTDFQLLSQNCRGLTDRKKMAKVLRKVYPMYQKGANRTIACFQETHQMDKFTLNLCFRGVSVLDNGERNQKGVGILIPESFELCLSKVSGVGRWAIAVTKNKGVVDATARKLIVVNVYAPNCHRESITFFQELFYEVDTITDVLTAQGDAFEVAIVGDFNFVLDSSKGAQNRTISVAERELALLVRDAMLSRNLVEPSELCRSNCHTWRRGTCLSKLDYVFLTRSLMPSVVSASNQWHKFGANFDHAALLVSIEAVAEQRRGRSFPKIFKSDIRNEGDKEWLLEQLRQCEDQIPLHWNPHMKLDFIKTMIRSKTLELRQMNKFIDNSEEYRNEINSIMAKVPINAENSNRIEVLKLKLAEIEEREAEVLSIKAGIRWREEGEKSTSYFLSRFKARTEGAMMHSIRLIDRMVKGSENILVVVQQFYKNLYSEHKPDKLEDVDFCNNFFANCPTLLRDQKAMLAKPIDLAELKESLRSCSDSAPGLDGIPYSFYDMFPDLLLKYVLDSWNYALAGNGLAESHKRACISLLPKQGKDLTSISNWRPISLSPCDLKIVTKSYANRLKVVLPEILCESQAAYVPGRDISFNNRVIQCARRYAVNNNLDFSIISLDAQKAFDSVSHKYLIKVMEAYEFPQEFIDVFRTLYSGLLSVVQVNGFLSQEFQVHRGVKQGDALSCGLFVLAMDPLLRNLSQNINIEGLVIPTSPTESVEIKVLAYADDVTIICRNNLLQQIFSEYESFSKISGLVLNAGKTEVMNFVQSPETLSRISYLDEQIEVGRVDRIRICGVWLSRDTRDEYRTNVLDKIMAMEAMITGWKNRHLSLNGKMIVAKTFLLSLLVFPAQVVRINKSEIKKVEKLIYSFVNGSKSLYGPERISRSVLKAPKELGGIGGVDVESFVKAIAAKQFDKASRAHRILNRLQGLVDSPLDDISSEARAVFRENHRCFAASHAMPNLNEIEFMSGIPMTALLIPTSRAAKTAALECINTTGELQEALNDRRRARTGLSVILRALPSPISALIRAGSLINVPSKLIWMNSDSIQSCEAVSTKVVKIAIVMMRLPNMGVKLEKIYKRADWPPPGIEYVDTYKHLWMIKNPTLRACRLKLIYKDVFSNERRFRFRLADSPDCEVCGQIESVEHHFFLCTNATRMWDLYYRITGFRISSFFEVLTCSSDVGNEIIKSTLIKALIQINRSSNKSDREIVMDCRHYIGIEVRLSRANDDKLKRLAENLRDFR